jgi:hypothetical protein
VQRHQPHPVEFRVPDREDAVVEVDVIVGQCQGLPDPQATGGKQAERRLAGRCAQRGRSSRVISSIRTRSSGEYR